MVRVVRKISRKTLLAFTLLASATSLGSGRISAAADTTLPAGDFPQCSVSVTTYCISEVVFIENSVEKAGVWVASGTATNDANGAANTTGFTTFNNADTNYTGRWSYNGFPVSRNHDGVYVRAYAPNAALGSDLLRIGIEPAGPLTTATGQVGRIKDATTGKVGSLDKAMGVRVKIRLGGLTPALNLVAGENVVITRTTDGTTPVLSFQATPTVIPIVSSSSTCTGSSGKADALVNQLYMYMLWSNGTTPFGTGGLSGNMTITSNGFCSLTTPVWNATDGTFDFTASAPHFAPNGTDTNTGFYRAVIPAADAKILFGLEPADIQKSSVSSQALISASTALEVEITESDGVQKTFTKNVGYDGTNFIVSALNFTYSSPKIRMKKSALTPVAGATTTTTTAGATTTPTATGSSGTATTTAPAATGPSAPRITGASARSRIVSVTFTAATGVSYSATATNGSKSASLKCAKKGTKMTCTSRSRLAKGNWTVTVRPTKSGVAGTDATKKVKVS